jgi:hypothetical protein
MFSQRFGDIILAMTGNRYHCGTQQYLNLSTRVERLSMKLASNSDSILGGQNHDAMVGGQKQRGCALLPLTSGVPHPIERVPYGGLCIILNLCVSQCDTLLVC